MKTRTLIARSLPVHTRTTTTPRLLIIRRLWLWTGFLAFATIAFGPRPAQAAVTEAWLQRYNGPANGDDQPSAVAVDGSGNVVVTGSSGSHFDSRGNSITDYYTAKYAAVDGALLWERRYNGPANENDQAYAMALDGSGNVVVTGNSWNGTDSDYYTAKYAAANGGLLWEKRYNGPSHDFANAVAVDSSGNVVVTGSSYNGDNYDNYAAKYGVTDGALLWEQRYSSVSVDAVAVDGSGNVVVTGSSESHYYTAKYAAADGALLWERRGPRRAVMLYLPNLAVDGGGNVVVTGTSFNGTNPDDFSNPDYYTAKYAAVDGALLWEKRYNGPANADDYAHAVAVDGNGNVVVTGTSWNGTNNDSYTAKYAAADGALLWEKRYDNSYAYTVAVDGSGNVVVMGPGTAKYAAADGALLWEMQFPGPAFVAPLSSHGLALGPNGMVALTGSSNGGYATVVYREVPKVVSINLVPTGVRLRFSGISGRTYNIERAPAVTGPWNTINIQTAPASGLFEYLDTNPLAPAAFYRTSEP